jgi:tRNA(adenine34) deaminase
MKSNYNFFLKKAIAQSKKALKKNEVPVGAVLQSLDKKLIIFAHNLVEKTKNPLMHAEYIVILKALKKTNEKYLDNFNLYVTLEPCFMCASIIEKVRIKNLYFCLPDKKSGGVLNSNAIKFSNTNIYYGFFEKEVENLMKNFFKEKR